MIKKSIKKVEKLVVETTGTHFSLSCHGEDSWTIYVQKTGETIKGSLEECLKTFSEEVESYRSKRESTDKMKQKQKIYQY